MDHFFKAHSSKRIANMQGKSKRLKKNLRLMLNGYERNDTGAIRNAAVERVSLTEDSDCDYTLNGDSDLEQVELSNTSTPVSSGNSVILDQPPPVTVTMCNSHTDREDVSHMMTCITNILTSDSNENDYSILDASDLDSSTQELDTYDIIDSSLDNTNTSSSAVSEFDCDGKLALRIIENLNEVKIKKNSTCQIESEIECEMLPSASGFITRDKRKRAKEVKSVELVVPKSKKNKKFEEEYAESFSDYSLDQSDIVPEIHKYDMAKYEESSSEMSVYNCKNSKNKQNDSMGSTFVSFDASDVKLPNFLSSFRDYKYSTSKSVTPRTNRSIINSLGFFHNEQKFNDTQISVCINESSSSDSFQSRGSEHEHCTTKDLDAMPLDEELLNNSLNNDEAIIETAPTSVQVHLLNSSCIVVLSHPTQFYIHGKMKVSCLNGTVEIMGYKLQEKSIKLYAPRFSFAHTVKTVPMESGERDLFAKLTSLGMERTKIETIINSLDKFDSVVHLETLPDDRLTFVEKEFSSVDLFHMSNRILANEQFPEAARILSCSLYADKPYRSFVENSVWPEVIKNSIDRNSKGIICGGKGAGKSTFLKYYINKMLSKGPIAVMDLDPGQAEFTVAGNISVTVVTDPVIGLNFTHLQKPKRMLNVGLVSVLDNVERYICAVRQLICYAMEDEECSQLPWVINTMGMSNALGLKIITFIILLLRPTHLIQMDSKVQKNCFEMLLTPAEIKRVYSEMYKDDEIFDSLNCPEEFNFQYYTSSYHKMSRVDNLTAKDKRYMCFLSYFGGALSKNITSLLGVRPFVVELSSVSIITSCKVEEDAVTSIINGKIVSLCEVTSNPLGKTFTQEDAIICHGHGLVRGVDLETESLYIITSEQMDVLSLVNVLQYCESHPDLPLNDEGLSARTLVPYRASLRQHNRQLMKSPKRRFNPLQLLKMKNFSASK